VAGCPQSLGHAEAVHVGQHHIEDDEIWLLLEHGRDGLRAVSDRSHGEARETQAGGQKITDVGLVIDDQNPWSIAHAASICALAECLLGASLPEPCVGCTLNREPWLREEEGSDGGRW